MVCKESQTYVGSRPQRLLGRVSVQVLHAPSNHDEECQAPPTSTSSSSLARTNCRNKEAQRHRTTPDTQIKRRPLARVGGGCATSPLSQIPSSGSRHVAARKNHVRLEFICSGTPIGHDVSEVSTQKATLLKPIGNSLLIKTLASEACPTRHKTHGSLRTAFQNHCELLAKGCHVESQEFACPFDVADEVLCRLAHLNIVTNKQKSSRSLWEDRHVLAISQNVLCICQTRHPPHHVQGGVPWKIRSTIARGLACCS